jgi:replicative DNA helicase
MNKDFFDIPIPYDEGAERAVLGSLIVYYPESDFILNILKPEDFYEERNRIVYETIIEIINEGHKINAQTIKLYLEKKGKLEEIGGLAYILELIEESLPVDALEPIVKDLKDKAVARGLIELAKKIIVKAKKIKDVNQLIEEAEAEIFRLNEERSVSEYYPISEIIQQVLKIINDLSKKDTIITGIPSGFYDLDKLTTGFHEGDLVIIAARPAMGKTSFALSIIHNVSVIERLPSAFFSLEMSKEQIGMRLLSLESRIPLKSLRSGFLGEKDLERLTEVALDIAKAPIYIDDTASLSILELRAKARRLKREKDIKLIVVDYLQLMRSHRRTENRQQEVAEISRGLKALAKELNIPVIALAQLSRQVEIRADKRPQLADLRESGSIEQDADLVMFIHRPEYYKKNPTPEEEGLAEIIIAKQRNGPTGIVKLAFIKDITKFENLAMIEDEGIEVVEEQPQQLEESLIGENEDLFSEFEEDNSILEDSSPEEDDVVDL